MEWRLIAPPPSAGPSTRRASHAANGPHRRRTIGVLAALPLTLVLGSSGAPTHGQARTAPGAVLATGLTFDAESARLLVESICPDAIPRYSFGPQPAVGAVGALDDGG